MRAYRVLKDERGVRVRVTPYISLNTYTGFIIQGSVRESAEAPDAEAPDQGGKRGNHPGKEQTHSE